MKKLDGDGRETRGKTCESGWCMSNNLRKVPTVGHLGELERDLPPWLSPRCTRISDLFCSPSDRSSSNIQHYIQLPPHLRTITISLTRRRPFQVDAVHCSPSHGKCLHSISINYNRTGTMRKYVTKGFEKKKGKRKILASPALNAEESIFWATDCNARSTSALSDEDPTMLVQQRSETVIKIYDKKDRVNNEKPLKYLWDSN